MTKGYKQNAYREATNVQEELKKWTVRRVECIRGSLPIGMLRFHCSWVTSHKHFGERF